MPWVPGYEQYFNQPPGTKVAGALAVGVTNPQAETAAQRTGANGLINATYSDQATLMLLVTPRLQNYAAPGVHSSEVVENVAAKLGLT